LLASAKFTIACARRPYAVACKVSDGLDAQRLGEGVRAGLGQAECADRSVGQASKPILCPRPDASHISPMSPTASAGSDARWAGCLTNPGLASMLVTIPGRLPGKLAFSSGHSRKGAAGTCLSLEQALWGSPSSVQVRGSA